MRDGPSGGENQAAGSGKQSAATLLRSQRNSDDSFLHAARRSMAQEAYPWLAAFQ